MNSHARLLFLFLSLGGLNSFASDKDSKSLPITIIKAARIFDGVSGKISEPGIVVVEGDRIRQVGKDFSSSEAQTIDLHDATLMPGFIDAHVHFDGDYEENWYKSFFNDLMRQSPERALYGARNARRTLEAGFTTVRDVGSGDYVAVSLRNAINAGVIPGPRMLVSNYAIGSVGGHADQSPFPPQLVPQATPLQGICSGADQCRAAVRSQIKYGADLIKFMPSGGVLSLADAVDSVQLTQEEMNAIVSEAHTLGRKVAAHCHGNLAAKMAIKAGVDSIEHGSMLQEDTLLLMKKKGVYLVPTLFATNWIMSKQETFPPAIRKKMNEVHKAHLEMFQNAVKLKLEIAFGTDSGVEPHGLNAREFALMTQYGMKPAEALMAGTNTASKLLGIDKETGTLVAGKQADIIALPGNPLDDIRATEKPIFVMKAGIQQGQSKDPVSK